MALPRTEKQIDAAKLAQTKRLGQSGAAGMRKRCRKGKSCGASCINSAKFCLVDLPWATGGQVKKVAAMIQGREPQKPKEKTEAELKGLIKAHHEGMKLAATVGDGVAFDDHRAKLIENRRELEKKVGKLAEIPMPKWEEVAPIIKEMKDAGGDRVKFDAATKKLRELFIGKDSQYPAPTPRPTPKLRLPKLESTEDFKDTVLKTGGYYSPKIEKIHNFVSKLLGSDVLTYSPTYKDSDEEGKFSRLRNELVDFMGGMHKIQDAYLNIRRFTGNSYSAIRAYQKGIPEYGAFGGASKSIEKFLSFPGLDRPSVIKYRGINVNENVLEGMIESARQKGAYKGEATSSWSTSLSTARGFSVSGDKSNVIFRTINRRGVPINSISTHDSEYELLTTKDASYRYLSYRPIVGNFGKTYHVFDVEET